METDFLAGENYFVPIPRISFLLETVVKIYFKRILYYGQWQWIFFLMGTILSHSYFFLKPLMPLAGDQYFKKILFLLVEKV